MQEAEAIRQCQSGDPRGFRWIYDRYGQPLLAVARRMLGDAAEAEDAVQDSFIRAHRAIGRFRGDSQLGTWLFKIHMRVCLDHLARRRPEPREHIDTLGHASPLDHELRLTLDAAIAALPDQQRACFVLHTVSELKQEEIAESLGLSVGGVKSNIFHAKRKLRAALAPELEGSNHGL